jgi:hypothetical protein
MLRIRLRGCQGAVLGVRSEELIPGKNASPQSFRFMEVCRSVTHPIWLPSQESEEK